MTNKELQEELKKFPDDIEVGIWEPYKKPYIATIGYIDKHDGEMRRKGLKRAKELEEACGGRDVERHMVDWWISGRNFDEWLAYTFYQGKLFEE